MKVSAVVVSHGHAEDLRTLLPALEPQVDELVVVANVPGSVPEGMSAIENEHPAGFAANVNRGVAATSGRYVVVANPDAVPDSGAIAELVRLGVDGGAGGDLLHRRVGRGDDRRPARHGLQHRQAEALVARG